MNAHRSGPHKLAIDSDVDAHPWKLNVSTALIELSRLLGSCHIVNSRVTQGERVTSVASYQASIDLEDLLRSVAHLSLSTSAQSTTAGSQETSRWRSSASYRERPVKSPMYAREGFVARGSRGLHSRRGYDFCAPGSRCTFCSSGLRIRPPGLSRPSDATARTKLGLGRAIRCLQLARSRESICKFAQRNRCAAQVLVDAAPPPTRHLRLNRISHD